MTWRHWYWSETFLMNLFKSTEPCTDCKKLYPPACMEWDHCRGSKKKWNIGKLIGSGNYNLLLKEIEKCELVCANCHNIRTFNRKK